MTPRSFSTSNTAQSQQSLLNSATTSPLSTPRTPSTPGSSILASQLASLLSSPSSSTSSVGPSLTNLAASAQSSLASSFGLQTPSALSASSPTSSPTSILTRTSRSTVSLVVSLSSTLSSLSSSYVLLPLASGSPSFTSQPISTFTTSVSQSSPSSQSLSNQISVAILSVSSLTSSVITTKATSASITYSTATRSLVIIADSSRYVLSTPAAHAPAPSGSIMSGGGTSNITGSASQWLSPSGLPNQPFASQRWTSRAGNETLTTPTSGLPTQSGHLGGPTRQSHVVPASSVISANSRNTSPLLTLTATATATKSWVAITTQGSPSSLYTSGTSQSSSKSQSAHHVTYTNSVQPSARHSFNSTRITQTSRGQESAATFHTLAQSLFNVTATQVSNTFTAIISSAAVSAGATTTTTTSRTSDQAELRPSKIAVPTSGPTPTSTMSAAAAPAPLLSKPQTAGVAVAGATGLLLAVIAAIFLVRRYYARSSRRSSTSSVYPKIAYLYDPVTGGPGKPDDHDDCQDVYMSGAASGPPTKDGSGYAIIPQPPVRNFSHRDSTGSRSLRFSDPGNPFRDPEVGSPRDSVDLEKRSLLAPPNSVDVLSAVVASSAATAQKSPKIITTPPVRHAEDQASIVSPSDSDVLSPIRGSILAEIASMAYNPRTFQHSNTRYQPASSSGLALGSSMTALRDESYIENESEPLEHDLLLEVDTDTESADFVTLTPKLGGKLSPTFSMFQNKSVSSLHDRLEATTGAPTIRARALTIESFETRVDSLMDDNSIRKEVLSEPKSSPRIVISSVPNSSTPVHRGWDDIKRYSIDKVVPAGLTSSPSLINLTPPPPSFIPAPSPITIKRKALPFSKRKEPMLAGSSPAMLSTSQLPLTIKVPFTHKRGSRSESRLSSMFKRSTESLRADDDNVKRPTSSQSAEGRPISSILKRKKSKDLDFACAGV